MADNPLYSLSLTPSSEPEPPHPDPNPNPNVLTLTPHPNQNPKPNPNPNPDSDPDPSPNPNPTQAAGATRRPTRAWSSSSRRGPHRRRGRPALGRAALHGGIWAGMALVLLRIEEQKPQLPPPPPHNGGEAMSTMRLLASGYTAPRL